MKMSLKNDCFRPQGTFLSLEALHFVFVFTMFMTRSRLGAIEISNKQSYFQEVLNVDFILRVFVFSESTLSSFYIIQFNKLSNFLRIV